VRSGRIQPEHTYDQSETHERGRCISEDYFPRSTGEAHEEVLDGSGCLLLATGVGSSMASAATRSKWASSISARSAISVDYQHDLARQALAKELGDKSRPPSSRTCRGPDAERAIEQLVRAATS